MSGHVIVLPLSEETNDEVSLKLSSQYLGEEINVGNESGLEDDWDVRGVEKFDWIWLSESSHLLAAQREFNSEALEINDNECHNNCGEQIAEVWSVLSVNSLLDTI